MFVFIVKFDSRSNASYSIAADDINGAILEAVELSRKDGSWFNADDVKSVERAAKIDAVAS